MSTIDPIANMELQLSHILSAIASLSKQQTLANETLNKKLCDLAKQQDSINTKLNLMAKAIGFTFDFDLTHDDS